MREIRTEVEVAAPPSRLWDVLVDFSSYPAWNPFLVRIDGFPEVGATLQVHTKPPGRSANSVAARVLVAKAPAHLRWEGTFLSPLLFSGTHIVELQPSDGGTRVVNREEFRGILAPLMLRFRGPALPNGYTAMNVALKARVEATAGTGAEGEGAR